MRMNSESFIVMRMSNSVENERENTFSTYDNDKKENNSSMFDKEKEELVYVRNGLLNIYECGKTSFNRRTNVHAHH